MGLLVVYLLSKLQGEHTNESELTFKTLYNVNKERHYEYGGQYDSSELVFNMISDEIRNAYNPFGSCASAQMLIKKERKK